MILPSFTQRKNERHYVTFLNLQTTSGLSILLYGVLLHAFYILHSKIAVSTR